MKLRRNRKGFTLLEILIVIVILAVIAGLAVPIYTTNVRKAYATEALHSLQVVREHMTLYWSTNQANPSTYTGATYATIGHDPGVAAANQTLHFSYAAPVVAAQTFTVTASLLAAFGGAVGDTIVINQAGVVTRNGVFA